MKTNLQLMRKKAGYKSAASFAESIGINKYTYTEYEQGRTSMTLETAWNIAVALGCTLDDLVADKPKEKPVDTSMLTREGKEKVEEYIDDLSSKYKKE